MAQERLHKVMAEAGVASRRHAEAMIAAGRVTVNGEVVTEMGVRVDPERDRIEVDGKPLTPEAKVYLALNKPDGVVTTAEDTHDRQTVVDLVPANVGRVYPVGRLDMDSQGLILLTNDGDLAYKLTHPGFEHEKEYRIRVAGHPSERLLADLARGIELEDGPTAPAQISITQKKRDSTWLQVVLHEGRKRQVRRMFEAIEHPVRNLIRVRIGPIQLGNLPPGQWRRLSVREIEALRRLASGESVEPVRPPAYKAPTGQRASDPHLTPGPRQPSAARSSPRPEGRSSRPAQPRRDDQRAPREEGRAAERSSRPGERSTRPARPRRDDQRAPWPPVSSRPRDDDDEEDWWMEPRRRSGRGGPDQRPPGGRRSAATRSGSPRQDRGGGSSDRPPGRGGPPASRPARPGGRSSGNRPPYQDDASSGDEGPPSRSSRSDRPSAGGGSQRPTSGGRRPSSGRSDRPPPRGGSTRDERPPDREGSRRQERPAARPSRSEGRSASGRPPHRDKTAGSGDRPPSRGGSSSSGSSRPTGRGSSQRPAAGSRPPAAGGSRRVSGSRRPSGGGGGRPSSQGPRKGSGGKR